MNKFHKKIVVLKKKLGKKIPKAAKEFCGKIWIPQRAVPRLVPDNDVSDIFLRLAEGDELELEAAMLPDGRGLPVHNCHFTTFNLQKTDRF